jgi:predicted small metal-binding protein
MGGNIMERYCVDCRNYPGGDVKCSLALSADSEEELLEAAVQHGTAVHGYKDTPELREKILNEFITEGACTN